MAYGDDRDELAPEPPTSVRLVGDDVAGRLPRPGGAPRRVPDSALAGYLRQAEAILAAHPGGAPHPAATVPDPFERLRWFELPHACLTPTRAD